MRHLKEECRYCPTRCDESPQSRSPRDWEAHPSWITGMEALNTYGNWVSAVVLPIAFQWIEEHKQEVYASVPEELKDDVGVVIGSAFGLIREQSAYKEGQKKSAAYEAALAAETWDPSKTNPVWTHIVKTVRAKTEDAFLEQSSFLED
jgi:hypothetical protein